MDNLKRIDVSILRDHPRNPRLFMREDVINGIASNLGEEFPKKHALHVRPVGDAFEIISGHHRKRAAEKKGLPFVWCWVDDLDDESAYMALATSNNQGELSPLEIGKHALYCEQLSTGGRGKRGGLSAYAERIGQSQGNVSRYRQAAEVLEACKPMSRDMGLSTKARHLAAIHKLPREGWPVACQWIVNNDKASVAEVEQRVKAACEMIIDDAVLKCGFYLQTDLVVEAFLRGKDISKQLSMIVDVYGKTQSLLDADLQDEFRHWFLASPRYDIKDVQGKRIELETSQWERNNKDDVTEKPLVSVLLADPPWRYDFAETDSRQIENQYPTATPDEIVSHIGMPWFPDLADDCVLFMWATAPKMREAFFVLEGWGFEYKTHAVWDKEKIGMGYWFRGQHEILIVATRGNKAPPQASSRFSSVFREKRGKHSRKPECVYSAIESMFPSDVKFEMYSRQERIGWMHGGNEVGI